MNRVCGLKRGAIAMTATPQKTMTLSQFLTLPETKPASEFVDGKIYQKPMQPYR
jgi:Uma2 family endonuclease